MTKSNQKQVLGRGLSALLNDPKNEIESITNMNSNLVIGKIVDLPLDKIDTNPFQPRTHFNEESLNELSISIRELGVIQPVTVRKLEKDNFQLVSGERRLRASKIAGLKSIPAYIRIANDQELLEMALVENIQREDLDPIEIGLTYQRLIQEINITQNQLSIRVGKKRSTITNYMRLLKLDPIIQTGIRDGFISMGHGRALISLDQTETQLKIYKQIVKKGLSVRSTENLVRDIKNPKSEKPIGYMPTYVSQAAEELKTLFKTSVSATSNTEGKGILKINFESQEQLQHILNKVKGEA